MIWKDDAAPFIWKRGEEQNREEAPPLRRATHFIPLCPPVRSVVLEGRVTRRREVKHGVKHEEVVTWPASRSMADKSRVTKPKQHFMGSRRQVVTPLSSHWSSYFKNATHAVPPEIIDPSDLFLSVRGKFNLIKLKGGATLWTNALTDDWISNGS